MSFVLAIEPDRRQAAYISSIVSGVGAELVLVESAAEAVSALQTRAPDLVLVPALLSPADDAALVETLHTVSAPAGGRILITPRFSTSGGKRSGGAGLIARLRRRNRKDASTPDGCDPAVFAEQVTAYLEEARREQAASPLARTPVEQQTYPSPAGAILLDAGAVDPAPVSESTDKHTLGQEAPDRWIAGPVVSAGERRPVDETILLPTNETILPPRETTISNHETQLAAVEAPPPVDRPPPQPDATAEAPGQDAGTILAPATEAVTPSVNEQKPLSIAIPDLGAGSEEWRDVIASLRRSAAALRFEEWLGQPEVARETIPDEWGIYDPERYGVAAFIRRLDSMAGDDTSS